jgi:hypothetical protein
VEASADFMISSQLMNGEYVRLVPDYRGCRTRHINLGGEADGDQEPAPPPAGPRADRPAGEEHPS